MAWIQNVKPPANTRQEFSLANFSGGLNNRTVTINDNEASDLLNMAFLQHDVMEKRKGFELFDELVLDAPITFTGLYKPFADPDQLIRATNHEVYANQTKICDVEGEIDGENFQGHFYFCDGENLYVYGKFTTVTSTYTQIIGYNPNQHVVLRVINTPADFEPLDKVHVRGKTVYNFSEGTIHYEPCENELDDYTLGFNAIPEHPKFIAVHKGRLFISGDRKDDDNVFITDVQKPLYFAVGLPIQLPPNSDKVRGMIVFDDNVIVGREHDIYRITGETSDPRLGFELFTLRRINTHTGVANNKCMDVAHSFLFFLGSDGISYALTTVQMDNRLLATQILSNQIDVFKAPIMVTREDVLDASTVFDSEFWYVTMGDKTLVYSYRHRAWTMYNYVDMYSPFYYYNKVIWGRKDGTTAQWGEEHSDNGRPIFAYWQSKPFTMDSASRYKQFREFYVVAHAYDDTDTEIRVTFEIDHADVRGEIIIENQLALWGHSRFGDRFIDRNINASVPFMIGRRARNMRIRYANGHDVKGTVGVMEDLHHVPRKRNYHCYFVTSENAYFFYLDGQWKKLTDEQVREPMRVYEINGEYEMKGKR